MESEDSSSSPPDSLEGLDAGIFESSSAWLVGFALSPAEYKRLYNIIALKRKAPTSPSGKQSHKPAGSRCRKAKAQAKALAHVIFPRPDVVASNNIEIDPTQKSLGTLTQRYNSSEFSVPAELYTDPARTIRPAIRIHSRLFLKSYIIIVLYKSLRQLRSRKAGALLRSILVLKDRAGAKISLSLTAIALSYKIVYGALVLLKPVLKEFVGTFIHEKSLFSEFLYENAQALIPLISGITAGSFLKLYPEKNAGRDLISVYALVRSLEFVYNWLEDNGSWITIHKPKLIGSWALFPFAYSQLFYAFFFERAANPPFVNSSLFSLSNEFFVPKPSGYPRKSLSPWPKPNQIVDSIAEISKAHYPKFMPTLLFPDSAVIPKYLDAVKPIIIRAHPAINSLTGALLHPWEPSQFRALVKIIISKYASIGKYVFLFYLVKTFLLKNFVTSVEPDTETLQASTSDDKQQNTTKKANKTFTILSQLRLLLASLFNTWRTTTFIVMTISSSWAGVEFWQSIVGGSVMPVFRYRIIGFLSGLWAIFDKVSGRGRYMYAVRAAILSHWRVLIKEKKVRAVRNGDVYLFSLALGVAMALMEVSPGSVSGPAIRKIFTWISDGTFIDPIEKRQRRVLGQLKKGN